MKTTKTKGEFCNKELVNKESDKEANKRIKENDVNPIDKLDIFGIGLYCPKGRFDTVGIICNRGRKFII